MSDGAIVMAVVIGGTAVILAVLLWAMVRSIRNERSPHRTVWREFGLSIVLLVLFLASWVGQGVAQWQTFTDEERSHGEEPEVGDFISDFSQSTLENWQSEFLQLFSFIALSALYIHKGSAESKDSDENVEASLHRIEAHLGTLPSAPAPKGTQWKLPETPLEEKD